VTGPACQALAEFSYVEALCWIGACLADALHYAAERGVVHLDLKPSNVLLAADGQPLLLDFHLARAPLPAGAPAPAWLGGTPGYMAPEQEAALTAVCEGRPLPMAVDHRADIRALGLVLYEALGGTLPPPADAAGELRRRNRQVSTGLADILVRCLAPDPAGRYPTAAALAADLRRHLADLPLRGVANRSLAERWRKWQRRRPFVVPLCTLLLGALAAGGAFLVHVERQSLKADAALREGQDHLQNQRYAEAADSFRHGLALVEDLPFNSRLQHQLREQHHCAERGQAAQELHLFCERLRPLYGANTVPSDRVREIEEHCRRFWEDRRRIADDILEAGPAALAPQLRADLLDLAILWTDLRVRRSPPDKIAAIRQEALDTLAEAERLLGPSVVLCQERKKHALALGMKEMAAAADRQAVTLRPTTAWEHCALGRAYFQAGDWTAAAAEMERSLELEPRALWPNFYKGTCAFHAGNYPDAVAAFSVCVVLAPESAWAWHNRGLAYTELGRLEPALADFTRALYLDATLVDATLWRGIAHYRAQHYGAALADLRRAHDQGADGATVAYHQALVHVARHNRPAALASIRQALRHDPAHPQAKQLLSSLESEP
jgi:tetratricopeptide (TPR) repeat protein